MRRFRSGPAGFGLALAFGFPALAPAQTLQPGDRIRVVRREVPGPPLIGRFVRSSPDSLWVETQRRPVPIGLIRSGLHVERSLGRRSRTGVGALIGAGVGAGVTVLFLSGFCGGDNLCNGDEQLRAVVFLGLPCVALGAGIGALIRIERWAPVVPDARSSSGRLQLGVVLAW